MTDQEAIILFVLFLASVGFLLAVIKIENEEKAWKAFLLLCFSVSSMILYFIFTIIT